MNGRGGLAGLTGAAGDVARTGNVSFGGAQNTPRTFSGLIRYSDDLFANGFEN